MNNENSQNKSVVTMVLLVIVSMIIGILIGVFIDQYITSKTVDKLNDKIKKIETENKKLSSKKEKKLEKETKMEDKYIINKFENNSYTYEFKNNNLKITFSQARGNDINSGLEYGTNLEQYSYAHVNIDTLNYPNVDAVGVVEGNDITTLALMSGENSNKVIYYSNKLTDINNMTSVSKNDVEPIMESFKKLEVNGSIQAIGTATKDNINYPCVILSDGNYILSSNGTLTKID